MNGEGFTTSYCRLRPVDGHSLCANTSANTRMRQPVDPVAPSSPRASLQTTREGTDLTLWGQPFHTRSAANGRGSEATDPFVRLQRVSRSSPLPWQRECVERIHVLLHLDMSGVNLHARPFVFHQEPVFTTSDLNVRVIPLRGPVDELGVNAGDHQVPGAAMLLKAKAQRSARGR